MDTLRELVRTGDAEGTSARVEQLLADGHEAEPILRDALIPAMDEVGELFQQGRYYLPEMLIAARAMKRGLAVLQPKLVATGLEPFGGAQPRLIAARLALTPELEALRGRVRAAARSLGIALPRERFRPHITLARWGRRVTPGADVAKALSSGLCPDMPQPLATSMALYQSTLSPQGARYDILAEYPLVSPVGAPA